MIFLKMLTKKKQKSEKKISFFQVLGLWFFLRKLLNQKFYDNVETIKNVEWNEIKNLWARVEWPYAKKIMYFAILFFLNKYLDRKSRKRENNFTSVLDKN